ncbi:MAG: DUF4062 domain-containing protein [Colwellia sp.]|nr:DUF4062 domain-containing protein [Colwellia sp.]
MEVFYTVFVSSTFLDLEDERDTASRALMEVDCFPAGMELFPAADIQQFEYIKTVIDICDYYVLIIGGRYGSISEDGISFTEKEYDYAISKGIPVLAFVHATPEKLSLENSELSPEAREKLKQFKAKAMEGRLVREWNNKDDLSAKIITAITRAKKISPAIGWVRGNKTSSVESLVEINDLRKQNDELKVQVNSLKLPATYSPNNLADLNCETSLDISYRGTGGYQTLTDTLNYKWSEIFSFIAPLLLENPNNYKVRNKLDESLQKRSKSNVTELKLQDESFEKIKIQFMALGIIDVKYLKATGGSMVLFWNLTDIGKSNMLNLLAEKGTQNEGDK